MLDIAVAFLADEFNAYLLRRTGSLALGSAVPGALVNDAGKVAVAKGTVGVGLINIEEERVTRVQQPERVLVNGREIVLPPELRLNLTLMFVPNMATYDLSLRALSHVLTFFQSCPSFSVDEHAAQPPPLFVAAFRVRERRQHVRRRPALLARPMSECRLFTAH